MTIDDMSGVELIMGRLSDIENMLATVIENTTKKPRKPKEVKEEDKYINEKFKDVIDMYNKELGKNLKYSKCHKTPIVARIRAGFEFEDFRKVIQNKRNDDWFIKNPQYMLPKTLFGEKMDGYLACGKIDSTALVDDSYQEDLLRAMEEEGL